MGGASSKAETKEKPKKICCACPETKRARDECVVAHGADEDGACKEKIAAHLKCLRAEGFDV
jgi:cytochrome c oxidase assembly protein subunit 17